MINGRMTNSVNSLAFCVLKGYPQITWISHENFRKSVDTSTGIL